MIQILRIYSKGFLENVTIEEFTPLISSTHLIADVVTGKLDVPEAAARLSDEAEEPESLDEADMLSDAEEQTELMEELEE